MNIHNEYSLKKSYKISMARTQLTDIDKDSIQSNFKKSEQQHKRDNSASLRMN